MSDPLPHLATFLEAADRGSFTAAARALGLTQAAVSQRVQLLEADVRTPLFRRTSEGLTLTDAGSRLYAYAVRIRDLTVEARTAVTDGASQELLLAASSVPGEHLLPSLLASFRKRFPQVRVRVTVSDTEDVIKQVEEEKAHLGLVGGRGGGPGLEFRRFAQDELVILVPEGHSWWRRKKVSVPDLLAQPLVQREPGSASRRSLERALERLGVSASALNVVLELGSNEAITAAVVQGVGVAVLSRRSAEREVRAGRLRGVRVNGLALARDIYVVRNRRRPLTGPAKSFLEVVGPEPEARP